MPRSLRCAAHSPVGARIYLGMERDARRGRSGLSALALLTPPPVRRSCAPAPSCHPFGTAATSGCVFLSTRGTCSLFCCARAGDAHPSSPCGHGPLLSSLGCSRAVRLSTRGNEGVMGGPGGRQRTRAGSLPACSSDADPGELTDIVTPEWVNSKKCPRTDTTHCPISRYQLQR